MTKPTVTLDDNHIYRVDGIVKPGVSQVLDLYFPPSPYYTEEGRDKGTARHKWYDFLARGNEPEQQPDERIAAEVAGFRKFLVEVKPRHIFGEVALHDPVLDVCGKPDLYCEIQGRLAVVDYKPANAQDRWRIQTAAYQGLLTANGHPVLDRYALRLLPGDYRLDAHKNRIDLACWRSFVAGYKALEAFNAQ